MASNLRKVKKELEKIDYYYSGLSNGISKGLRLAIDIINKEIERKYEPRKLK